MIQKRVTLRDVAEAAGVHHATVGRAMDAATRGLVHPETAARIDAAAESLGYRPNRVARALKSSRTRTIGVLIPDLRDPIFPPIVRGVEDRLGTEGYTAIIVNTDGTPEGQQRGLRTFAESQVDGLVLASVRLRDAPVLDEADTPLVLVNRRVANPRISAVMPDDRGGVRLAVNHLRELGHAKIGHIAGPQAASTGKARRRAFLDTIVELGLDPELCPVETARTFREADGRDCAVRLLERNPRVTAILASNDLGALGALDAVNASGLSCPDDLSLIGFNDIPMLERVTPSMTTIRIPHYEMGVEAADLLLAQLHESGGRGQQRVVPVWLVARGSTAKPPVERRTRT